jgi:TRAP-type C4-dicarboxylate transport system substrate-binding protein
MRIFASLSILLALAARPAVAGPVLLKMAAVAPEGTAWARELRAFSREIESATHGELKVKWYLGGIAGDDKQMADRMAREQLDGAASAGMLCLQISPSLRVLRVHGLVRTRDEAQYIQAKLGGSVVEEARAAGYALLGLGQLGVDVIFTRAPVSSWSELRKLRLWRWDLDDTAVAYSRAMGLEVVTAPLADAARVYDEGKVDGFIGIPSAALGLQWYEHAHHLLAPSMGALPGCLIMRLGTFQQLSAEQQSALRAAGAKLGARFEEVTRQQDDALLGGLFAKQGVRPLAMDQAFTRDYFEANRLARDQIGGRLVPLALRQRVASWLADWRAEHPGAQR